MEQKLTNIENRLTNVEGKVSTIETKVTNLEVRFSKMEIAVSAIQTSVGRIEETLAEFMAFTKAHFERHEGMLEELKEGQKRHDVRLGGVEDVLKGVQQAFLFKAF